MEINAAGLAIIKESEGLVLTATQDPGGKWTIGYGHTGPEVVPGLMITQAQADAILAADVASFNQTVTQFVTGPTVTVSTNENQFSAMVSLAYNIGARAFGTSTLLKYHLAGRFTEAQQQFALWDKAHVDGQLTVEPGLVERRGDEATLYGTAVVTQPQPQSTGEATTVTIGGSIWTGTLTKTASAMLLGAGLGAAGMASMPAPPVPIPVVQADTGPARLAEFETCYRMMRP